MRTPAANRDAGVEPVRNERVEPNPPADRGRSQAILLAAGRGSRLANGAESPPKPLARVGGITLLERTLLTLKGGRDRVCHRDRSSRKGNPRLDRA